MNSLSRTQSQQRGQIKGSRKFTPPTMARSGGFTSTFKVFGVSSILIRVARSLPLALVTTLSTSQEIRLSTPSLRMQKTELDTIPMVFML